MTVQIWEKNYGQQYSKCIVESWCNWDDSHDNKLKQLGWMMIGHFMNNWWISKAINLELSCFRMHHGTLSPTAKH